MVGINAGFLRGRLLRISHVLSVRRTKLTKYPRIPLPLPKFLFIGHSADLEPTGHLGLENTGLVVLFSNSPNKLHILGAVGGQRILVAIGIVQVNELIFGSD